MHIDFYRFVKKVVGAHTTFLEFQLSLYVLPLQNLKQQINSVRLHQNFVPQKLILFTKLKKTKGVYVHVNIKRLAKTAILLYNFFLNFRSPVNDKNVHTTIL